MKEDDLGCPCYYDVFFYQNLCIAETCITVVYVLDEIDIGMIVWSM